MDSPRVGRALTLAEWDVLRKALELRQRLGLPSIVAGRDYSLFVERLLAMWRTTGDSKAYFAEALRAEHPDKTDEEIAALLAGPWEAVHRQLFGSEPADDHAR